MWGFDDIREKIVEQVDKIISAVDPLDRIGASLKCQVEKWFHPAYVVLCKRETGLSDAEAERLGLRRSTAVWRVREFLRPVPTQPQVSFGGFGAFNQPQPTLPSPVQLIRSGNSNVLNVSDAKALDLIKKEEALKFC
ncbi:hypothetical protein FS837_012205 [Tulasnella sp. UAMH 9824]|nr:hypothetical protein FS837_012205 [Tulasnella sp. UAMH 9824]